MIVIGFIVVGVLGAAGLAGWWMSHRRPTGRGAGFNVLLITLDTTRADHLGCYGQPGNPTPQIDRLASEGTRFTQCTTAVPSTLPSHASILTGVYPFVHAVRHNVGYRLSEANVTLAEVFKPAGYRTAAYVGALVVNRDTGLDQGFDTYDDVGARHERRADEVCDGALGWLRRHADERFFLWTHFFDPHAPYDPPEPFRRMYRDPYVAEIAFVDTQVGRLLDELRSRGLENRTLTVVVSDHGEGLGQHGEKTHLYYVYDTTLSVPLIFHCPGRIPAGRVVQSQVRTVDIAPTVLAFVGLPPLSIGQGVDLTSQILGDTDADDLPAYGETLSGQIVLGVSALRCLRTGGWKYIHAPRPELYDLARDPREEHNVVALHPEHAAAMVDQLREIIAASPSPVAADDSTVRPDRATLDRLQSLGYVAGDIRAADSAGTELDRLEPVGDDPKDHAADFEALGEAIHYLQAGQYAQAEATYRRLVADFPNQAELGMQLARSLFLQGKFAEAIAVYRGLVERHPDHAVVQYGLGKLLDRVGDREEAIRHFAAAVRIDGQYAEAYYDLGVALRNEGRGAEAADCFRQAVRIRPTYVDARINLGACLSAEGQMDEAVEQYRAALTVAPDDPVIHYNLGNALLRKGDRDGALECYQRAVSLKPDFAAAQAALESVTDGPGSTPRAPASGAH